MPARIVSETNGKLMNGMMVSREDADMMLNDAAKTFYADPVMSPNGLIGNFIGPDGNVDVDNVLVYEVLDLDVVGNEHLIPEENRIF